MKKIFLLSFSLIIWSVGYSQLDTINNGSSPGDGTGETLYNAFAKVNDIVDHINKNLPIIDTITSAQILAGDSVFIVNDTNYLVDYIVITLKYETTAYSSASSDTVIFYTQVNGVNTPILGLTNELFAETESFSFVTDAREIKQGDGVYWWSFPSGKYTTGNSFLIIRTYRTLEL